MTQRLIRGSDHTISVFFPKRVSIRHMDCSDVRALVPQLATARAIQKSRKSRKKRFAERLLRSWHRAGSTRCKYCSENTSTDRALIPQRARLLRNASRLRGAHRTAHPGFVHGWPGRLE